jgi:hypothetical protein
LYQFSKSTLFALGLAVPTDSAEWAFVICVTEETNLWRKKKTVVLKLYSGQSPRKCILTQAEMPPGTLIYISTLETNTKLYED